MSGQDVSVVCDEDMVYFYKSRNAPTGESEKKLSRHDDTP